MDPLAIRVRVLIVDDSEDDAVQLLDDLRRSGYDPVSERVETAEALHSALTQRAWDVVLAEAALPQLPAGEALRVLRELGFDLPFIVVAAGMDEAAAADLRYAGTSAFILKDRPALVGPTLARELLAAEARRQHRQSEDRLRLMDEVLQRVQSLVVIMDESGAVTFVNEAARTILGYEPAALLGYGWWQAAYDNPSEAMAEREQIAGVASGQLPAGVPWERAIKTRVGETRWVLWQGSQGPGHTLIAIGLDITERKRAEEQTQTQLRRLAALHNIDMAISGSLDRNMVLGILLDEALVQLQADAATVLIYNPATLYLEHPVRRGFRTAALQHTRLRLGQGLAGQAAKERRPVSISDLAREPGLLAQSPLLAGEGFVAYQGVPLIAKGQVKGVLEVFHRNAFSPSEDWLNLVALLGGQAAIAIENAELFVTLQRSSEELAIAYDATIEGWSRALDLRDHDTEGHTRRVTELSLRLARALGVPDAELVHIRRGALLHDIGKLAVPDSVLLKPGPLTEAEMALMRRHPVMAYTLLSPIGYLRPALDIPYAHHEKWDGTGYPRGLRGEEIPLAARIFAVADVWDALRSNRPYRPAWPEDQVRAYIQSSAGTHFDPKIIPVFLKQELLP